MNQQYKHNFIKAGQLAKEVRDFGKSLITSGASYNSIISQIYHKITQCGGIPAFPPQIALNNVAAHFLPDPKMDIILCNEIVKLDIGVCYQGAIGDCAVTVDLSGKYQKLIDAVEAALLAAEQIIKVGLPIKDIGILIETTIGNYGFKPIYNLSGHGLGFYQIHTPPTIPNCFIKSNEVIKPGMTFAIEPFATNGKGFVYEVGNPQIFAFSKLRSKQRSVLSQRLVSRIKTFQGLPFSIQNLMTPDMTYESVKKGVEELLNNGTIMGYGPLLEEGSGMVAQAENSVLVDEDGIVIVTTR